MSGEQFYRLGLTGYPLDHSLSPRLHSAALKAMGLAGEYRLYPVDPQDGAEAGLRALCERLRRGELTGLNVTVPHKTAVLPLVDELTDTARAVGAVNTLYCRSGRLIGDNTDAPGFLADLRRVFPQLFPAAAPDRPPAALVLGAGGSARAVVYALAAAGWEVRAAARRMEQAGDLAAALQTAVMAGRLTLRLLSDESLRPGLDDLRLVVNATPAGMSPHMDTSAWPAGLSLPARAAVYDLVYNPPETPVLRAARLAGLPAANGLGMLIEQAALALEKWTGQTTPREAMWAEVL